MKAVIGEYIQRYAQSKYQLIQGRLTSTYHAYCRATTWQQRCSRTAESLHFL